MTLHRTAGTTILVAALAVTLAACGGDEPDAATTPAPDSTTESIATTEPDATPTDDATTDTYATTPAIRSTLCDLVPPEELAAALGVDPGLTNAGSVPSNAQLPSADLCRFDVPGAGTSSQVTLGVGILSITADDLTAARAAQSSIEYADAPELGEGGYFDETTGRGVFLVDDRAVVIRAQLDPAPSLDQVAAAAAVVTPHVSVVAGAPAELTEDECDPYADAAAAVLGAPAEVRRDRADDLGVSCGFATREAFVNVFVSTDPQAVAGFDGAFEGYPGVEDVDAGQRAQYVDGQGAVLIDDTTTATVLVEPVPESLTPEITELLKVVGGA